MLIDMIHDNHGEPPFKTRYRDPGVLAGLGYQAIVIPGALTAIPAARDEDPAAPSSAKVGVPRPAPRKPADIEAAVDAHLHSALARGMQVYFYGDALSLPRAVVEPNPQAFFCDDGTGRLCPGKHAVLAAVQEQVQRLFDRWPAASGLVMRTGEVYPVATPHMVGSPLLAGACPVCRGMSPQDRQIRFIQAMHQTVIIERRKRYIHRAWLPPSAGAGSFHDNPDAYREISSRLPDSGDLVFSFKYTRGDFRQPEDFNPCLIADDRPKWIEFQCEREFEGKGAFPNYQAAAWRGVLEHLMVGAGLTVEEFRRRFSVWGWSRGGGWGGPYVQREEWIDSNVRALADLYRNPTASPGDLATAWTADAFGIAESSAPAPAIAELLLISAPTIQRLLYVQVLGAQPRGTPPWVRDDLLDVEAIWHEALRIAEAGRSDAAIAEKREALTASDGGGLDRIRKLLAIAEPDLPNKSQARDLANSLAFYGSFAGTIVNLFIGFVRYADWFRSGRSDQTLADAARTHLQTAQAQWQLHTQLHAMLPGAPSVFHENTLWDRTHRCLAELSSASIRQ